MCFLRYQAKCKLDTWNPRSEVASVRGNLWLQKVLLYFSSFLCQFKTIITNLSTHSTLWLEGTSTVALQEPVELFRLQEYSWEIWTNAMLMQSASFYTVFFPFFFPLFHQAFFSCKSRGICAEKQIVSATLPPYAFLFGNLHKQQNIKTEFITPLKKRKYMQKFQKETMGVQLKSLNPESH